jgi:uncharacterized protein
MADIAAFFEACAAGDVPALTVLLGADASLARARDDGDRTGLHVAVGHPDVVRLLLAHGADPDARETGDNATPLHLAAAQGVLESVALLIEAGADVHGEGDAHEGGVIGWAAGSGNRAVLELLLANGAQHHIFSALARRDHGLVRRLVAADAAVLQRRRSRYENMQTVVQAAFAAPDGVGCLTGTPDHDMLTLLIELGADVDAPDDRGRTPMDLALLRGDRTAMRLLHAAGARATTVEALDKGAEVLVGPADTIVAAEPMFVVRDARQTVAWYQAIGFTLIDAYEEGGALTFGRLTCGPCRFAFSPGAASPVGVTLWIKTSQIDATYASIKARQLVAARAALAGDETSLQWPFEEDLYTPFYGGRQFSVRDPNGLVVVFHQAD